MGINQRGLAMPNWDLAISNGGMVGLKNALLGQLLYDLGMSENRGCPKHLQF